MLGLNRSLKEIGVLAMGKESSRPSTSPHKSLEVGGCMVCLRSREETLWLKGGAEWEEVIGGFCGALWAMGRTLGLFSDETARGRG